jgi:hypothetical protein
MYLSSRNISLFVIAAAVFAGITVYGVLFLPIVAWVWYSNLGSDWRQFRELAAAAIAVVILLGLLFVYLPDSLLMFHNRMTRGTAAPFWFSIWRFAPTLYSPTVNSVLIVMASLAIYLAFYFRWIEFFTSIISLQFVFFVLANYLKYSRFETYIFLPLLTIKGPKKFYAYLAMTLVQLHYDFFMRIRNSAIDPGATLAEGWSQVALANMTLVGFLVIVVWEALERRSPSGSLAGSGSLPQAAMKGSS